MNARFLFPTTALAACVLTSGCISLLPKQPAPVPLYALASFRPGDGEIASRDQGAVIGLKLPEGPTAMLGDDLVWRRDQRVAFIEGATWSGPARLQLVAILTDTLRRKPGVRSAALTSEGVRTDVVLHWSVDAFEVQEDGESPAIAHFVASASLLDARNRALISTKRVGVSKPLTKRGSAEAARALQEAAQAGVEEISEWASAQAQPFAHNTAGAPK